MLLKDLDELIQTVSRTVAGNIPVRFEIGYRSYEDVPTKYSAITDVRYSIMEGHITIVLEE